MAHNRLGSQKLQTLHQQLESFMDDTDKERHKLEEEREELKRKEDEMRGNLQAEFDQKKKELQESCDELVAERKDWEEEKERVKKTKVFEKVVTLDVGVTKYRTTLSTLTKYPDSMLGVMFSGRHALPQQEDGSYFIDRDGEAFRYVLMYLRDRDHCFDYLQDDSRNNPQGQPSPLESPLLKLVACEAQYFQLRELETQVRIILNPNRAQFQNGIFGFTAHQKYNGYNAYYPDPQCYDLDYGQDKFDQCHRYTQQNNSLRHHIIKVISDGQTETEFKEKITFDSCDLSGATLRNCYFQKGVSFEGCIMRDIKFERVGGLVRHKVHFAPWQVAQADFEPELLQALKDNGCIY